MTVVTVDDLHTCENPRARLANAAALASVGTRDEARRIVVRVPDKQTDGIRIFRPDDVARMLQRHGKVVEIGVTDGGTICAAVDVVQRRGELAIWTGPAIGAWSPADIVSRGLGGSETAAVRLAEQLAEMGYVVTLYGHFESEGLSGDVMLRHFQAFDPTEHLDALVMFRNATALECRPNADFVALWLEDLAPAEGLTPARATIYDRICAVTAWHKRQVLEVHPWLEESHVAACRNGIVLEWFEGDD